MKTLKGHIKRLSFDFIRIGHVLKKLDTLTYIKLERGKESVLRKGLKE